MRSILGLCLAGLLFVTSCGAESNARLGADDDAVVLQLRSEGGFAPVEFVLGRGPNYTLLGDGRLIHLGPTVAMYPGPLLPNYRVTAIGDDDMDRVLALVTEIGLPGMDIEIDDTAMQFVADATTEVVTFWDDAGAHSYSVYALGIEPEPSNHSTAAFLELTLVLDELVSRAASEPFAPDRVRVIAGSAGLGDPEFETVDEWPLPNTDFSDWVNLPNGWMCTTFGPDVLETFAEADQASRWLHPDPMMDADTFTLLVRPLHPGEPGCPGD